MIRRKKSTIVIEVNNNTTVKELKQMIAGIFKVCPADQCLFTENNDIMTDDKQLQDFGITDETANMQSPTQIGLALRLESGDFEELEITPYLSSQALTCMKRKK